MGACSSCWVERGVEDDGGGGTRPHEGDNLG